MKNYQEFLAEEMKNPEFKREWDALEPEFRAIRRQLKSQSVATTPAKYEVKHEQFPLQKVVTVF